MDNVQCFEKHFCHHISTGNIYVRGLGNFPTLFPKTFFFSSCVCKSHTRLQSVSTHTHVCEASQCVDQVTFIVQIYGLAE